MTTGPVGGSLATAAVDVVANLDQLDDSLKSGLTRSVRDANRSIEAEMRRSGERAGQQWGDGVRRGADGRLRDARGRFVPDPNRVGQAARRSGFRIGSLFGGGFLRGFNVAGISLGPALLPIIGGSIAPLLASLVQVSGAAFQLSGALALIPAGLAAIGAVVATLNVGLTGVSDTFKALAKGDTEKFAEEIAKLAPNAQAFVREVQRLGPAWRALRLDVQQQLFTGLDSSLRRLAASGLPVLRTGLAGVARQLAQLARVGVANIIDPEVLGNFSTFFANLRTALGQLAAAVGPIVRAFSTLAAVGSGAFPRIATAIATVTERFNAFIERVAATGQLEEFISGGLSAFASLGRVILNVVRIFSGLSQASQGGAGLFSFLEEITARLADFVNSIGGQEAISNLLTAVSVTFRALGSALSPILAQLPLVAELMGTVAAAVLPLLPALGDLIGLLIQTAAEGLLPIAQALATTSPEWIPLIQSISDLVVELAPAIELLGQLAAVLVAGAVVLISFGDSARLTLDVLGLYSETIDLVVGAFTRLQDVVLSVSGALLDAVAGAFAEIISWVQRGVSAFQEAYPNISAAIDQIISAVTRLVGVVPGLLAQLIGRVPQLLGGPFREGESAIRSTIGSILSAISGFVGDALGRLRGGLSGVGSALADPFEAAAGAVRGALGNVLDVIEGFVGRIAGAIDRIRDLISNIPRPSIPNIPGLPFGADGGLIPKPTVLVAGEAGPEVLIPLTRPKRRDELLDKYFGPGAPPWGGPPFGSAGSGGGRGGRTVEIHAPVTVNAPPGVDASDLVNLLEHQLLRAIA